MALSEQEKKLTYEAGIAGGLTPEKASATSGYVITPDVLQNQEQPIQLPEQPTPTTPTIEGNMAYFDTLNKKSDEGKALEEKYKSGEGQWMDLLKEYSGMGEEQLGLEQKIINPIETQIADITGQANVLTAEFRQMVKERDARKAQLKSEAGAAGVTRQGVLQGQQLAIDVEEGTKLDLKAADIGLLQAQALSLQGKVEQAQKQIDRAIDLKYKGIEKEIDLKKYQLDSIKDLLTAEETKRADALEYALGKEEDRIKDEKEEAKISQNMLIQAGIAGASQSDINKANDIIKNGGTAAEIAQVLGKYSTDYLDYKIKKAQLSKLDSENAKIAAQIKAAEKGTGISFTQLSEDQQNTALKLSKEYINESQDFIKIRDAYNRIVVSAEDPSAAGDLALIFNYMKILDPGSTVREGEFANAQNSGGVPDIIRARYNKVISGQRLSDDVRVDFVDRSTRLFTAQQTQQEKINDFYNNLSSSAGIPNEFVTRDTSSALTTEQQTLEDNWSSNIPDPSSPTTILDNLRKLNAGEAIQ